MAIWQFNLTISPKVDLADQYHKSNVPIDTPYDLFSPRKDTEIIDLLDTLLPRYKSWSENILSWGEEAGNRISAYMSNNKIEGISARIDVRQDPVRFLNQLIVLANYCNAKLITDDYIDIKPNKGDLIGAIQSSDAMRFVNNPRGFIENLRTDSHTDSSDNGPSS